MTGGERESKWHRDGCARRFMIVTVVQPAECNSGSVPWAGGGGGGGDARTRVSLEGTRNTGLIARLIRSLLRFPPPRSSRSSLSTS